MTSPARAPGAPIAVRAPEPTDAAAMWRLAAATGVLDVNSPYAYLLVCTHFAATSVVAAPAGPAPEELAGFVSAYRPPSEPDAVFVWQVAVADRHRGAGLGRRLVHAVLDRPASRGARVLTATVTPSNAPSDRLFRAVARDLGVACDVAAGFPAELFPPGPGGGHEPERAYRIGPLPAPAPRPAALIPSPTPPPEE